MEFLWVPATLAAAGLQTARNAMQHRLTAVIGVPAATQIRFLYGLPFAVLFLALALLWNGSSVPTMNLRFAGLVIAGAAAQVAATALMLAAMRTRAFAVTIAYTKTEPVQVALFGLLVLADPLTPLGIAAIVTATLGVLVLSFDRRVRDAGAERPGGRGIGPAAMGLASGAAFAVSAVAFRGAILALPDGPLFVRVVTTLVCAMAFQTFVLGGWLLAFDRAALKGSLSVWRSSMFAGCMGASASVFWFIGFGLTAAANVRTLGLVEVVFAMMVARRMFSQSLSRREAAGLALILLGIGLLLAASR